MLPVQFNSGTKPNAKTFSRSFPRFRGEQPSDPDDKMTTLPQSRYPKRLPELADLELRMVLMRILKQILQDTTVPIDALLKQGETQKVLLESYRKSKDPALVKRADTELREGWDSLTDSWFRVIGGLHKLMEVLLEEREIEATRAETERLRQDLMNPKKPGNTDPPAR